MSPSPLRKPCLRETPMRAMPTQRLKMTIAGTVPLASEAKGLAGM